MNASLLVLAAGMGNRFGGLKQLEPVGPRGERLIDYSLYDAIQAGFEKIVFVVRRDFYHAFHEAVGKPLSGYADIQYAFQDSPDEEGKSQRSKPWGTGHAVLVSRRMIDEPFLVINADDYYGPGAYKQVAEFFRQTPSRDDHHSMVGYKLSETLSPHGSVSRGVCTATPEGFLKSIREETRIRREGEGVLSLHPDGSRNLPPEAQVSMNLWGFKPTIFPFLEEEFTTFRRTIPKDSEEEFFIPRVVNQLLTREAIQVTVFPARDQWFGMTYRRDRKTAALRISRLVSRGVYPDGLFTGS